VAEMSAAGVGNGAAEEVAQLDNVLLRLAMIESDERLQTVLAGSLPLILNMLSSQHGATKKKVMEVLGHINKRTAGGKVALPLPALVQQYLDEQVGAFQKNFTLIYIKQAFSRASSADQVAAARVLLSGIAGRPAVHQNVVYSIGIAALPAIPLPATMSEPDEKDLERIREQFPWLFVPADKAVVLSRMLITLLSNFASYSTSDKIVTPRGMTEAQRKELGGGLAPATAVVLDDIKVAILALCRCTPVLVTATEIVCHAVVGACDPSRKVSQEATTLLQRVSDEFDLEDAAAVRALYELYLGTPADDKSVEPQHRRLHASAPVKLQIMALLCKSVRATNTFPFSIKVIFDSSYGAEANRRSKEAAVRFIKWTFTNAEEAQLRVISPLIFSGLRKLIKENAGSSDEAVSMKVLACTAMVPLCKRLPKLFCINFGVVLDLFDDLLTEQQSVQAAIQDALSFLAPSLQAAAISEEHKDALFGKLQLCVKSEHPSPRLVAVKFAALAFPFDELRAREICLLAANDGRSELRVQAAAALRPYRVNGGDVEQVPGGAYPPFAAAVAYFHAAMAARQAAAKTKEAPYPTPVFNATVGFLRRSLEDSLSRSAPLSLTDANGTESEAVQQYRHMLEAGMATAGQDSFGVVSAALLHLVQCYSASAAQYAGRLAWLKQFVHQGQAKTREHMAKVIAVLVGHLDAAQVSSMVEEFLALLPKDHSGEGAGRSQHELHGNLSVLGLVVGHGVLLRKVEPAATLAAVQRIVAALSHKSSVVTVGAVSALGSIARFCELPLPIGEAAKDAEPATVPSSPVAQDGVPSTRWAVVEKLAGLLRSKNQELVERAAMTLADITLGDAAEGLQGRVIEALFSLSGSTREDLLFSAGDALSIVAAGWASAAADSLLLCPEHRPAQEESEEPLRRIVKAVVQEHLLGASNSGKQLAGAVWLLCLVQHAGGHAVLQANLPALQQAFTHMLASANDVVQEIGSRGMVLVYEKGSEASRRALVAGLMGTLDTGAKGFKPKADTQLFPAGLMGKTPDGGSISTYRELSALARDMGKPELMYKFMGMASHHALWSSRRGAAFAASSLANSEAREQMQELLPALVPRLYRSSYDPSPGVASAMSQLLRALAGSSFVDAHWEGIVAELLAGMQSKQWRVREASCMALADALRGRSFGQLRAHLKPIYYQVFRVMDGIKESVVKAAIAAGKILASVTVRLCDPRQTPTADVSAALGVALPFLLEKGLVNDAAQVQQYSLATIQEVARAAGGLLAPYVPELMATFLENLSNVEPESLQYFAQKTDQIGVSAERLEELRVSLSKSSPMSETLDICAERVDASNARQVAAKLQHLVRHGVGMPTHVGTANFFARLCRGAAAAFRKYAARLLPAVQAHLCSSSAAVRRAYAGAVAAAAAIVPSSHTAKLLQHLRTLYCEKGELVHRQAASITLRALAHVAAAKLKENNVDCVPLVFLGTCDTLSQDVASAFSDLWAEVGVGGAARLYRAEISALLCECLASSSWPLRAQGAAAAAKLANKLEDALWPEYGALEAALLAQFSSRRLWTGKEAVLAAAAALLSAVSGRLLADDEGRQRVRALAAVLLEEAQRKNVEYQRKALHALAQVLHEVGGKMDLLDDALAAVLPVIEKNADVVAPAATEARPARQMDEEYREASQEKARRRLVQAECFGILGKAWPTVPATQLRQCQLLLDTLLPALEIATWNVKLEILKSLVTICDRSSAEEGPECVLTSERVSRIIGAVAVCAHDPKYEVVREAAFGCIKQVVLTLKAAGRLEEHRKEVEDVTKGFSGEYGTHLLLKELGELLAQK